MGIEDGESRPRVLVVEDEPDLASVYQHWLSDDYDVGVVTDGESALDQLDGSIDVVLLDRLMPGMSGDEVLELIREKNLDCRVAMVTAVEPDFDIIPMGFDAYLTKPLRREEIRRTVRTLLARSRYAERSVEYSALVEKYATLQATKSPRELERNEEFAALERRIEQLRTELREQSSLLVDGDAFVAVVRDLVT